MNSITKYRCKICGCEYNEECEASSCCDSFDKIYYCATCNSSHLTKAVSDKCCSATIEMKYQQALKIIAKVCNKQQYEDSCPFIGIDELPCLHGQCSFVTEGIVDLAIKTYYEG